MATISGTKHPWDSIQHQFRLRKPVRPFVSSTFTDFEQEREHLVKYVFPQLNSLCHQRGTYFAPVDLRWGISEDQSHAADVVSLCLDYIKHCHPFFICLLGERYGTYRSIDQPPLPSEVDPGEKYSDFDWLGKNFLVAAAKGHDWILQKAYQNCSITELEIIEAAFRNDNQFCRFYIRDVRHIEDKYRDLPQEERKKKLQVFMAEDEETEMLVTDLKYRIANKGLHTQSFLTVEELGQKVLEDWVAIINQFYPPMLKLPEGITGEQFNEWALGESLAETRRRVFVPTPATDNLFQILNRHALELFPEEVIKQDNSPIITEPDSEGPTGIITLIGDRGCGKSAIVANWVKKFSAEYTSIKIIAHYVGSSTFSRDIVQYMRRTIWELRGKPVEVSSDMTSEDLSSFHEVCEAFVATIESTPCILILDGLDELGGTLGFSKHQVKELFWLPDILPSHCKIITTTIRSDLTFKALAQRTDNTFHIVPLFTDTTDKATVLEQLLALHCKCLNKQHLEAIVNAKLSSKPLFLSIVANELKLFGTYMKVEECLEQYTSASTFRDLWRLVIIRWTKDYGWTRAGRMDASSGRTTASEFDGWVADTLRLIACSREGLTEGDILKLLNMFGYTKEAEVTQFDFALFRSATFDTLVERPGGLLKFCHQHLREAVEYFLLGVVSGLSSPAKRKVEPTSYLVSNSGMGRKFLFHEILASFFQQLPHSQRKAKELPYHYRQCENWQKLQREIMKPEMFITLYGGAPQTVALSNDLLHYWRRLSEEDIDVVASLINMVSAAISGEGENDSVPAESVGWWQSGNISEADSLCSDLDSLASNDTQLESVIHAMREIELKEADHKLNTSHGWKTNEGSGSNVSSKVDAYGLPALGKDYNSLSGYDEQEDDMGYHVTINEEPSGLEKTQKLVKDEFVEGEEANLLQKEMLGETRPEGALSDHKERTDISETGSQEKLIGDPGMDRDQIRKRENETTDELSETAGSADGGAEADAKAGNQVREKHSEMKEGVLRTSPTTEAHDNSEDEDDDDVSMSSLNSEAIRSQPAVVAFYAGKFLAERSIFTQAAQVLQLAYQEVLRFFPLNTKEQFLLIKVQEALGNLSLYQLHKGTARTWYKKALATVDNMCLGQSDNSYKEMLQIQGRILNQLGNMAAYDRNTEEAEGYLKKAKKCMEQANCVAGQATSQYNLGLLRAKTGNFSEAERHLRKSLYAREHWYGKSHPGVAEVLNNLAGLLCDPLNTESYDRNVAEDLYQRALRIRKTVYGDDHLLVATTLFHLGKLLKRDHSLTCKKDASTLLNKALDIRISSLGPTHKLTLAVRGTLKQLEQDLSKGHYDHSRAPGAKRWDAPLAYSHMSWHGADLEVLDSKVEESRTKFLQQQKYGSFTAPHKRGLTTDGLGRERIQNRHLDKPRFRARSSSPALARDLRRSRKDTDRARRRNSPSTKRQVSPSTHHHHQNFQTRETSSFSHSSKRQRPRTASLNRSIFDPKPHLTMSQVSYASHHSSCDIPQAFDLHPSNVTTVQGPHSDIKDLMGQPPCPRPVAPKGVHTATWYHEPGRYSKDFSDTYPRRRHQRRPNQSFLPNIDGSSKGADI